MDLCDRRMFKGLEKGLFICYKAISDTPTKNFKPI